MSRGDRIEHGIKWWIRYVVVPLIGTGGLVGIVVALLAKPDTPRVGSEDASSGRDAPSLPNWVAPFELEFPSRFWAVGLHEYTLALDCSGSARDIAATNSVEVSYSAALLPDPVVLRLEGLQRFRLGLSGVEQIHPSQVTLAEVTITHLTFQEANAVLGGACAASIAWDGLPSQTLAPLSPYQVVEVPQD